jgi:hypothetical protein
MPWLHYPRQPHVEAPTLQILLYILRDHIFQQQHEFITGVFDSRLKLCAYLGHRFRCNLIHEQKCPGR